MNWGILGHAWAVDLLRQHVANQSPRHAYLFTGARGIGKRTLSLRLAQALNCTAPPAPGDPCLSCTSCQQIQRMEHPDLSVVQAEQRGGTLRVDQVRELQHSLALAPYQSNYRIALLMRFEEANQNAANALLKTLEEPPPKVILVLTAVDNESLLPTIVSRCELLPLRPMPLEALTQGMQDQEGISHDQARLLAHISNGMPGTALLLNREPLLLENRQTVLDEHQHLLAANHVERFDFAERLAKDRDYFLEVLQVWLSFWHDLLLCTSNSSSPCANLDRETEIKNLAVRITPVTAQSMVNAIVRTKDALDQNANMRLAAEVLLLDLPKI